MPSIRIFTPGQAISAIIAGLLFASVNVAAEHHMAGEEQPDPVVGGLMLSDPEAFKNAITTGYRASQLLGAGIFNASGDQVGSVNDIVVGSDLRVSVAIVSVGGFLGVGSRLVAVPTDKFSRGENGQVMLKGATKEALMAVPEFRFME